MNIIHLLLIFIIKVPFNMDSFNDQAKQLLPGTLLVVGGYLLYRATTRIATSVSIAKIKQIEDKPTEPSWPRERVLKESCSASMGLVGIGLVAGAYMLSKNHD